MMYRMFGCFVVWVGVGVGVVLVCDGGVLLLMLLYDVSDIVLVIVV